MQSVRIEPGDALWLELLGSLRHDLYHTPAYMRIEAGRLGAKAEAFAVRDGGKCLFVPYLVCRNDGLDHGAGPGDKTTANGYPGPLLSDEAAASPAFVREAFERLLAHWRAMGAATAFLRMHPIFDRLLGLVDLDAAQVARSRTIAVDLTPSEAQIWANTRKGHQSTINKCKRLGLEAEPAPYGHYRTDFLDLYRETMDQAGAASAYYFSEAYFAEIAAMRGQTHFWIVRSGSEVAAACFFFECCGVVQAHLGGTRSAYRSQSPFSLLLHQVRLWAKSRGNEVLHLGGGVGGEEDRVMAFKAGFGRQTHDYATLRLVIDQERHDGLVASRAAALGLDPGVLRQSSYFPAYRSPIGR